MITKYFQKVVVRFDPLGPGSKTARLFLALIPSLLKTSCAVSFQTLSHSQQQPLVQITFKDKFVLEHDPSHFKFPELAALFDHHSRQLKIKESIQG
ncbi:mitochondrial 54S ribosomal protein mL53 [Ascoidea rubescens DSM 1968]